jgi:hypothetical protein
MARGTWAEKLLVRARRLVKPNRSQQDHDSAWHLWHKSSRRREETRPAMPSSVGRTVFQLSAALAVVAGSFWVTLKLIDYWSVPVDASGTAIEVVDATYGKACQNFTPPAGLPNLVRPGNATAAVAKICDKAKGTCHYLVDLAKAADPAPGCAKDFQVTWRCAGDPSSHQLHLGAEAEDKTATLSCPPQ